MITKVGRKIFEDFEEVYVEGVRSDSLFYKNCKCGYLTIHGFSHQLKWSRHDDDKICFESVCDKCGHVARPTYKLTYPPETLIDGGGI